MALILESLRKYRNLTLIVGSLAHAYMAVYHCPNELTVSPDIASMYIQETTWFGNEVFIQLKFITSWYQDSKKKDQQNI